MGGRPAAPVGSAAGSLRDIVQNAPEQFRCALDQKLLCDPVVSPGGVVFERSTLARWLKTHEPLCPMTGAPLRLEDCHRSPEIRRQVTEWARGVGRARKAKKGSVMKAACDLCGAGTVLNMLVGKK